MASATKYPAKIQETLDDLAFLSDRRERIDHLIGLGEAFKNPSPNEVPRDAAARVPGCESEVYVRALREGGTVRVRFAVDNPQGISAMAMATILQEGLDGAPVSEASQIDEALIYEIFGKDLSMGKSAGLMGMVRMVRGVAT